MELAFWSSVVMLAYAYAGFPVLVGLVGLWQRREVLKDRETPTVSFIIAAYNEEAVIADRLKHAAALLPWPEIMKPLRVALSRRYIFRIGFWVKQ